MLSKFLSEDNPMCLKGGIRSPSAREKQRLEQMPKNELNQLQEYMRKLEVEDLDYMIKDRKSSKKLDGGPIVGGTKPRWGQPTNRHSIPKNVREDHSIEFGVSSYHAGEYLNLYDVLTNKFFKDHLAEKVAKDISLKISKKNANKRDWRNKAYDLRTEEIKKKQQDKDSQWGKSSRKRRGYSISQSSRFDNDSLLGFDRRSNSVLPPIAETSRNGEGLNIANLRSFNDVTKAGMLSPRKTRPEEQSVYKLETGASVSASTHAAKLKKGRD